MSLPPGVRLGPYEILSAIGAGGMGEVYRARDSKLNRDVAIKVLPDAFALDAERLARFTREAQTLASLNHPNIAHVHGLEESGGKRALVMELVEGDDLSAVIARGPIPFAEALPIAKQIAEALEAAHEAGIIHRDLKPANIKVRADGTVKVLDFGLAKAVDPTASSSAAALNSPTITTPAMTQAGMIMGTAAYMSPEQAKGRFTDKRTDVWAFGCVFYEMLTRRRAFDGEDVTDTIAAIVRGEPDWSALPSDVPPHIVPIIKRCLAKDRKARIPDLSVVRFSIDEGATPLMANAASAAAVSGTPAKPRAALILGAIATTAAVAAVVTWMVARPAPAAPAPAARFEVIAGAPLPLPGPFRDLSFSPNGQTLAFTTGTATIGRLWVRHLDTLDAVDLKVPGLPRSPFISADNQWVGFVIETGASSGELRKIATSGGPSVTICRLTSIFYGAAWGTNDTIVFAGSEGLLRVPAGGGTPALIAAPTGGEAYRFPSLLPGDRGVVFTIVQGGQQNLSQDQSLDQSSEIAVLDFSTGQHKTVIRGATHAQYLGGDQSGFLVYAAAGSLRAVRFDPVRMEAVGDGVPVVDQVVTKFSGASNFSASSAGVVYVPGSASVTEVKRSILWVNRDGTEQPIKAPPRAYQRARISPDGTRIALDIRDQENDIWIWDIAHETLIRLTIDRAADAYPLWTRDGKRILFSSSRNGTPNLYWQMADGTGSVERLGTSPADQVPLAMTPDGSNVLWRGAVGDQAGLSMLRLEAPPAAGRAVATALPSKANLDNADISEDGRWLAYESTESGRPEIHVRPFPNVNDGHWQVSSTGGAAPVWSSAGRELFFLDSGNLLNVVPVQVAGTAFNYGAPTRVLNSSYYTVRTRAHDIAKDGKKFLMIREGRAESASAPLVNQQMVVVLNWREELEKRIPRK